MVMMIVVAVVGLAIAHYCDIDDDLKVCWDISNP